MDQVVPLYDKFTKFKIVQEMSFSPEIYPLHLSNCQLTKDLVTCNTDFSLSLIDSETLEVQRYFKGHTDKVNEAKFTNIKDEDLLNAIFSASEDMTI